MKNSISKQSREQRRNHNDFFWYFEVKNNTDTTHQNLWDTAKKSGLKGVYDGIYQMHILKPYIRKSKQVTQIQAYMSKSMF